jgi:hypothetical protein
MSRRFLVHRARVAGIALAGTFLVLGVASPESTMVVRREAPVLNQVHDTLPVPEKLSSRGVSKCTSSASSILPKDDPVLGTMGAGLNCTGAPRAICIADN